MTFRRFLAGTGPGTDWHGRDRLAGHIATTEKIVYNFAQGRKALAQNSLILARELAHEHSAVARPE